MFADLVSPAFLIYVDLVLALLMVGAGMAAGWWLFRPRPSDIATSSGPDNASTLESERVQATVARIRDLATTVAQDVGAHTSRVEAISNELTEVKASGASELDGVVLDAVAQMLQANERLQSQLNEAEEKLQLQAEEIEIHAADARTDALTQINNRRAFDDELKHRHAEWTRIGSPFSVLLLDVDHFKKFNDVHGHQAGDEVLKGVARVLRTTVREMDIVCRYGGEEFAIIMPATDGELARQAGERARAAIEGARFRFQGGVLNVTASGGLSQILAEEDIEALVKRADDALYASKAAGRNCVHFHDGERSVPVESLDESAAAAPEPEPEEHSDTELSTATLEQLPDRGAFLDELRRRIAETRRSNAPLSVILINVDHYRTLAEQFGDEVGDLMLDTVAQYVSTLLRDMDLLGRYSQEQFCVMLPDSSLEDVTGVAQRMQSALAACSIPLSNSQVPLTVSQGLAEALASDDADSLVQRAVAALFASKAAGQGNVHVHNGESCQAVVESESAVI